MTSTKGARVLKILLGLPLLLGGLVFTALLWRSYQRAAETRHWTEVPALIISSQMITDRPTPHSPIAYKAEIHYRYTVDGKTHQGDHVKRVEGVSSDPEKPRASLEKYPAGKRTVCYVNPASPEVAILEHSTQAALYTLWFPLLFVIGGGGIMLSALKTKP